MVTTTFAIALVWSYLEWEVLYAAICMSMKKLGVTSMGRVGLGLASTERSIRDLVP